MAKQQQQQIQHQALGTHIIADLYSCKKLADNKFVESILEESAQVSNATILHTKFHEFEPQGLTGYILLAESHISIHTWPETGYAAVDVFTCGETMNPQKAIEYIINKLEAEKTQIRTVKRNGVTQ
jgi:S-adenosylmethionine decarboxylase proenzyme